MLYEQFRTRLGQRWCVTQVGGGQIVLGEEGLRLALSGTQPTRYADAQLDDYAGMARRHFPWRPPLRFTVRARASGPLLGTAGFGFWNNPFSPLGGWPALPAALWFFHAAPPSNMPLALGVPGHGWRAASIDTTTARALRWAPLALPVALANRVGPLQRRIWPRVQHDLCLAEAPIAAPARAWRNYVIEWRRDGARFSIDGSTVLEIARVPQGPLGMVLWVDNQWMVATPRGRFGWGVSATPTQWLDIAQLTVET